MVGAWRGVAERHGWFILASREFLNGVSEYLPQLDSILREVVSNYRIEFSGGHDIAPDAAYEEAARWLEGQW